ncbi:NDR1/HIN1-like protein 12 [Canna indica]|uniref:NDR1/HIN1-like protein 12 n=1 Tax=Canna indica TaxID=4628 RepID=A0AAQ3L2U1_9LILI|nr:NDR1/HIN1-like protein 12 [Canna indica]
MSLLIMTTSSSVNDCSKKGFHFLKKLIWTFSALLVSILAAVFLIWLVLHPSKPEFYIKDASVEELSLSISLPAVRFLNSTIQVTMVSKNPNSHVGIHYDQLRIHAAYRGQPITSDSALPQFFQGKKDTNVLGAVLRGIRMPVAPGFGYEAGHDQIAGKLSLELKLEGKLRWKVGNWESGRYRVAVDCAAVIAARASGDVGGMNLMQGTQCSTAV